MATFNGTPGNDNLSGTNVADVFNPFLGNDAVNGLPGNDTINYQGGSDAYDGAADVDTIVVPEDFDAGRFIDSTGNLPGGFTGTFQGGKVGGSPVAPFGYFYDTGTVTDDNGILSQEVELFQFDDFLFDARVSQLLGASPNDPTAIFSLFFAQGDVFNDPGPSLPTLVVEGINFTAGATVDTGTFGAATPLEIVAVNGTPVSASGTFEDVDLADGSTLRVLDQTVSPGQVDYRAGRDFLESLTGPSYRVFLGETVVDQTVTVTGEDPGGTQVDVNFDVAVNFDAFFFQDNYRSSNINGNDNNNTIILRGGDDYGSGGGGNDNMWGGGGNDSIYANNALSTDNGNDTLTGNDGIDELGGGVGSDLIIGDSADIGAAGPLTFNGFGTPVTTTLILSSGDAAADDGNDQLFGSDDGDFLITGGVASGDVAITTAEIFGTADDTAYGGNGDDMVVGAGGFDSLFGSPGNDTVFGLAGDDNVGGAVGDDFVAGGDGDDIVSGADGNDLLFGEAGEDILFAGLGDDFLSGGPQADVFWLGLENGATDRVVDFTQGQGDVINLTGFGLTWPQLDALLNAAGAVPAAVINLPNGVGNQNLDLTVTDVNVEDLVQADFIL